MFTKVSMPPDVTVHTAVVVALKATGRLELAVAVSVGVVPKVWSPGFVNVMLWVCCPFTSTPVVAATFAKFSTTLVPPLVIVLPLRLMAVPNATPFASKSPGCTVYMKVRVEVLLPPTKFACRTVEPIVKGIDGGPPAVTATGAL